MVATRRRPGARYPDPAPQCATCSVRTICSGCRHEDGCEWCFCDGLGCSGCGTKCRSHQDRDAWQADTGTLEMNLRIEEQPPVALPSFMPSVKIRSRMKESLPVWTYTVPVNDLITVDGRPRDIAYEIRDYFPEGSQLVLNFFAEDHYIEPIWTRGAEFWRGPGSEWLDNFDAIIGINFSLYHDDPSFEIMNCMKRMQMSNQEIHDSGHTVIPLVAFIEEKQLAEQVENYAASGLHTVAFQLQVVEGEKATYQRDSALFMDYVARHTDWRVIAYGIARPDVIDSLYKSFGPERLVVSNAGPYFDAMRGGGSAFGRRETLIGGIRKYTQLVRWGAGNPGSNGDSDGGSDGGSQSGGHEGDNGSE